MKFKILHTNDIHSRFENFAKIVTKVNEVRDESTILLDAGDFNDFMRIELQGTEGLAGVELLEIANYDAIAIGNNETFQGVDTLVNMADNSSVQFLSCNIKNEDLSELRGVSPSIIIERNNVRFLIIGTSPAMDEFYNLLGLGTVNYKEAITREMKVNVGKYDVCLLLSHLGLTEDIEIAETIQGINMIIDGHTHKLMEEPIKIKDTIIHMSGCYGENLGVLEFEYENNKIINYTGCNINVDNFIPDVEILKSLALNKKIAISNLSKPLFSINKDMWHDVMEENPMTNLLADALKDTFVCDVALINSGVLNGGIRNGMVSLKKFIEICPSPLNPTLIRIEGKYIREALEASMQSDFCMQDGRGSGFRGKYLGKLHISGGYIEHDGTQIKDIIIADKSLEEDKIYTVSTSDYIQRGTGYVSFKNNFNEKYSGKFLRHIIEDYMRKPENLENALVDRWILK